MKIGVIKEKKEGFLMVSIILAICCIFPFFTKLEFIDKIIIFIMLLIAYLIILFILTSLGVSYMSQIKLIKSIAFRFSYKSGLSGTYEIVNFNQGGVPSAEGA